MGEYAYLMYIAIILFSTKILGVFSRKLHMPQVVGALLAGMILGPSVTNLITLQGDMGQFLEDTAEIGVIFLMFSAGLDTDVRELKKNSVSAFVGRNRSFSPSSGGICHICRLFQAFSGKPAGASKSHIYWRCPVRNICKHYCRDAAGDGQAKRKGWHHDSWCGGY